MPVPTIRRQLARLRRRERLLAVAWGAARWLALVTIVLANCCLIDWWIDLRRDVPMALRVGMLVGQILLATVMGVVWVAWPLMRRLSDDRLALFVEDRVPGLGHRLISALQLNRVGARTEGMSPELIAVVTREAEERAATLDAAGLADHRPGQWAAGLFFLIALAALGFGALAPDTCAALIARQALAQRDVPRNYVLENRTAEVWPSGEPVMATLSFHRVAYPAFVFDTDAAISFRGNLRVVPDGSLPEHFPLEGRAYRYSPQPSEVAIQLPPILQDFTFQAWLGDTRLRQPGRVRLVPRPAVIEQEAWVLLPPHCGLRPDGSRYERFQPRGEVTGLPASSARVAIKTQKPIARARLELLGPVPASQPVGRPLLRTLDATLGDDGTTADAVFDLRPDATAYRIVVTDVYGFTNHDPPTRGLRSVPEEAPAVTLLPEQFLPDQARPLSRTTAEDFEVEGVPVPLGGGIRIGYTCSHPFGLGPATFFYRVNDGAWWPFPLAETLATDKSGPFDPHRGAFVNNRPDDQVQYHAMPSADPEHVLGRTEGGGRFDFQTRSLSELKVGDRIEYYVAVANRDPAAPKTGRSEVRAKLVVTVPELVNWIDATLRQEDRIRQLEQRQRGVFK